MEKYAKAYDVPFKMDVNAEEQKQSNFVSQFAGGLAEGFLGPLNVFGGLTEDPVTSAQQISRSLGSLIGFVPGLLGGGLKLAAMGAAKVGAKAGLGKIASLALKSERTLERGGELLTATKSVPIRIADWATPKAFKYVGKANTTVDKFLKGETISKGIVESATHLGVASAVGEVWKGWEPTKDAFIHGAIAGGAFGTIGNWKGLMEKAVGSNNPAVQKFAENKLRVGIAKGMLGAGFQGGMATAQDAPFAVQMYEYMIGGYFGVTTPSVQAKIGNEFYNKYERSKRHEMMNDPEFSTLHPEAQETARDAWKKEVGGRFNQHVEEVLQENIDKVGPYSVAAQEMRNAFKERVYDKYSTENNIKRNEMDDVDLFMAHKTEIDPILQMESIITEGSVIGAEIQNKKPENLTGKAKRVNKELTKEELDKVANGELDPIYNYLRETNEFYKKWDKEINNTDFIRSEEEASLQLELDKEPLLRRLNKDINDTLKKDGKEERTVLGVARDIVDSYNEVKISEKGDYVLHSGGAKGADSKWGDIGRNFGLKDERHYYVRGEETPKGNTPLTKSEVREADVHLQKANETLKRTFPARNEKTNNLLRRNWWQVKNADEVFAVSTITNNKVDGGTGWAVHMGIDNNKPVHVFDQAKKNWFTWDGKKFVQEETPTLTKNFAGIGSRNINEAGKEAIRDVYEKSMGEKPTDHKIEYGPTGRKHGDAVVGASVNYENKIITIDKNALEKKFNDKAWTKPQVKDVEALPKDAFKTYKEWEDFVVQHELAHTRIKQKAGESKGEYENRINQEALKVLSKPTEKIETGLYDNFIKKINAKLGIEKPSADIQRKLRQSFKRLEQDIPQKQSGFDPVNGFIYDIIEYNPVGKRKLLSHPKLPHEKIFGYEGESYLLNEAIVDGRNYNLLGRKYHKTDLGYEYDYVLRPDDVFKMYSRVKTKDGNKKYIWSPQGEKGNIIVRPYHPDTKKTKLKDIFSKDEMPWYQFEKQEFFKTLGITSKSDPRVKKEWSQIHEDMTKSNYLYDPEGQFKNVLELVKRVPLFSSKNHALDPMDFTDIAKDGKLNIIAVDGETSGKYLEKPEEYFYLDSKGKKQKKFYDSDVDGYVVLHTDLFNQIVKKMGFDPTTSHLKPVIATRINGKLFLLKGGIHPSRKGYDAIMPDKNSMIVMTSAAKLYPGKVHIAHPNKKSGEYEFYDRIADEKTGDFIKGNKAIKPESIQMNIEDLLMNFGVYGDKKALQPVSIKRQMHSVLNSLNMGKRGFNKLMDIFRTSFDGTKKNNKIVKDLLNNPSKPIPEKFDITKIGHKEVVDILNGNDNHPLAKMLIKDIIKEHKNFKASDDVGYEGETLLDANTGINRMEKILKDTNYNISALRLLESGTEQFNHAVLRYIKNKYLTPKWEWSGSSWIAGNDPLFKHSLGDKEIRKNHFMLGWSMGNMKHKKYGTLEQAWNKYQEILREDTAKAKDFKEKHLRIAVMRVPSSGVSGTRVLYFDGFVGNAKEGFDYGTYTRQKDHFNLDGADVDGDKVFLYQGMPKDYLDAVKKKRNNLEKDGITKINKNPQYNEMYSETKGAKRSMEERYINSKVSQYFPNALFRTGRNAASAGQEGLTKIVPTKENLGLILSDILYNKKGHVEIPIFDKEFKNQTGLITGFVAKRNLESLHGYDTQTVEASSRTADATKYYNMIDPVKMQNLLMKMGISNLKVEKWKDGKPVVSGFTKKGGKIKEYYRDDEVGYNMLYKSKMYSPLLRLKALLYTGKDFQTNNKLTLDEVQNNISDIIGNQTAETGLSRIRGSLPFLGSNFSRYKVKTDPLRFMDFTKFNNMLEALNKGFVDPTIRDMIVRKHLLIKPDYGKVEAKDKDAPRPVTEADLKKNDAIDAFSAVIINRAAQRVHKAIIETGRTEEVVNDFLGEIANIAFNMKDKMVKVRKTNPKHRREDYIETTQDIESEVRSYKNLIKEEAEALGINSKWATDYFDMYMLGSIYPQTMTSEAMRRTVKDKIKKLKAEGKNSDGSFKFDYAIEHEKDKLKNWNKYYNKTSWHRYPYESNEISNQNKTVWMGSLAKTFDLYRPRELDIASEVSKDNVQRIKEAIGAEGPETPQQKDQHTKEVIENKIKKQGNLFDLRPSSEMDAPSKVKRAAKDIADIFRNWPDFVTEDLSDMFTKMTLQRDGIGYGIDQATFRDIIDFRNTLVDITRLRPKKDKPTWFENFAFPRRVAQRQFTHDFNVPFRETIPFVDAKGNLGETSIKVPLGTMQYLQKSFSGIYNLQNKMSNLVQEERDKFFEWRKDILDMEAGVTEANKLHDAAIKYATKDAGNGLQLEYNREMWKDIEPLYDILKEKTYKMTKDGKIVKVSGEDLMNTIASKNAERLESFYNKVVTSHLPFELIDVYANNGSRKSDVDYNAFNKKSPLLKYNPLTGEANIEKLSNAILKPLTEGQVDLQKLFKLNPSLSAELLMRLQYEYQLEAIIKSEKISEPRKFRENMRKKVKLNKDPEIPDIEYTDNGTTFRGIGKQEGYYWPHMFHTETAVGKEKAQEFMEKKRVQLRSKLEEYISNKVEEGGSKSTGNGEYQQLDPRYKLTKKDLEYLTTGKYAETESERMNYEVRKRKIINNKVAELENAFEAELGKSLTSDNGSGEDGANHLLRKSNKLADVERSGFFSKPSSGRTRGDEPMPGYSYEFKVVEAYEEQWINSFFKNATALVAKRKIDQYEKLNPLKDRQLTNEWATIMKMYTTDVLGHPTLYNPALFGLKKSDIQKYNKIIKDYDKSQKDGSFKKLERDSQLIYSKRYTEAKQSLQNNKKFQTWDKNLFYYLTDEFMVDKLDKYSQKLWMGGSKEKPKLPFYGELPKSPEARRKTLARLLHKMGAMEAKWSLITLLSHPKTWVGNMMGGSHNTIANVGLDNFVDASFDKKKLLNTVFRGTKLGDGTEITTPEHLRRFAEESGALETFYVTEASLERRFTGKEAKEFMREVLEKWRGDPDLTETNVREIGRKYKIGASVVNAGALLMRSSERTLRVNSFYSHYLNSYKILKNVLPNLEHNNPYLIKMALKGVEATQFLYHSAFRPRYSRTSMGKVLTRFHPFAWNSIRFRRSTYQRARRYGFKPGTKDFDKFQRLVTMDMMAMALANVFVSSVFDSALPPPMSWMQDTADWLFGDEKERDRAFFSSWPHPLMAPLQVVTPPVARYALTPINAMINGNWERFADYYLWTFFPFGRLARSVYKTAETPEMWVEQMSGIPIHTFGRELRKLRE